MQTETIARSINVLWRDERRARATVNDLADVHTLLAHYGFPPIDALPFAVENEGYAITRAASAFPCTVTVERKPSGPLQEAAWAYAEESGMARIVIEEDELGVLFLDEDRFVPFSRLTFDPVTGFAIGEDDQ